MEKPLHDSEQGRTQKNILGPSKLGIFRGGIFKILYGYAPVNN